MKKNMSKKIKLLIVIGVFLLLGLIIGTSYAFYMASVSQSGTNVIKSDCFKITYTDQDTINLNNSFPMTDADGTSLTPYQFTVKNVCENTQYYEVNLETLSSSTIDESKLKVKLDNKTAYLYGNDGYASNKVISDAKNAIKLASGILTKNQEKTYSLRLYVDESVTTSTPNIQNKSYLGKVTVYAALNNRNFSISIQRNNSTIKEDRVQGTKLDGVQYEYDLTDVDITNATNISCNEDAQAIIEDNKLKISNMHENTICKINDTIKSTIDTLDDSKTNIKMIKNEDNVETMTIAATKDVVLDLNGKEIKSIGVNETSKSDSLLEHRVFSNYGKLLINDNIGTGGIYSGTLGVTLNNYTNGILIINGGSYNGRQAVNTAGTNAYTEINGGIFDNNNVYDFQLSSCSNCKLVINDGAFTSSTATEIVVLNGINNNAVVEINGGIFNSLGRGIRSTSSNYGIININGGVFTSTGRTIENNSGTININGGNFESTGTDTIRNEGSGTINITGGVIKNTSNGMLSIWNESSGIVNISDSTQKVYISRFSTNTNTSSPKTLMNRGNGTINIEGHIANACTENADDTTSGICIYSNNGRSLVNEKVSDNPAHGIININGAYIVSKTAPSICNYDGTVKIKNTTINSLYDAYAITNNATGTTNICNVNLLGSKIIGNSSTGYIYYAPNAFGNVTPTFAGTTANIQVKDDVCN